MNGPMSFGLLGFVKQKSLLCSHRPSHTNRNIYGCDIKDTVCGKNSEGFCVLSVLLVGWRVIMRVATWPFSYSQCRIAVR